MNAAAATITQQREQELWQLVSGSSDEAARLELIDHYLTLAHKIAARLYLNRPDDSVEFDDYYQFAVVGLIESVDRFIPGGESSFTTYASYRIRGTILNGAEKASESREQIAFKRRVRRERVESLAQQEDESQDASLFEQMVELTTGLAIGYMLEDSGLSHDADQRSEQDLPALYGIEQMNDRLHDAIEQLPERDRLIISYHYFHHISFKEISRIFKVSKGRISQIHKRVLLTIRKNLSNREEIDSYF